MPLVRVVAIALAAVTLRAADIAAQIQPRWSIEGSFLSTVERFDGSGAGNVWGLGFEGQGRYAVPGTAWSLGLGVQFSTHTSGGRTMTVIGGVLEPRLGFDVGVDRLRPYVAGRLARLRESSDFASNSLGVAVGGGGGFVARLAPNLTLDVGAAVVRQTFGDVRLAGGGTGTFAPFVGYVAKAGLSVGFGRISP